MSTKYLFLTVVLVAGILLPSVAENNASHYLTIQGKDIWVRDKPVTGKVVMKLNTGDKCTIISFDEPQVIKGQFNFWFLISFNGKQGWVFGSQSDYAADIRNESFDQTCSNFSTWAVRVCQTNNSAKLTLNPDGLTIRFAEEGENQSFNFAYLPVLENKYGSITCTREHNSGNASSKSNKTFLLGFKDSKWEFLTQFDGLTDLIIKIDPKRILFISNDVNFSSGVSYADDGKGGVAGNYKEILKRNLIVTMVAVADFTVKNVQTVELFNEPAPAKRKGMFGPIEWDEAAKTIKVTSSKEPVQLKWDPVKSKFVPG